MNLIHFHIHRKDCHQNVGKKNLTLNAIHQGLIVWEINFVQITERFFAFFQTIYANNNTQLLQE